MIDYSCTACAELTGMSKSLTLVLVMGFILCAVALIRKVEKIRRFVNRLNTQSMVTKIKHSLVFFQSAILLSDVYNVPYPT